MNFIKLVNFEVNRFLLLFTALVTFIVTAQIIAAFTSVHDFKDHAELMMQEEQLLAAEYVEKYNGYSMWNYLNADLFHISIVFAAAVLIIYVFFIWYRDWFGKSSFMYRLLMLPTARLNIYFAKLSTILLYIFFLVGIQVVLFSIVKRLTQAILPDGLYEELEFTSMFSYDLLSILYPQSFFEFIYSYGLGIAIVISIFTAILFERSFHLKGLVIAFIYMVLSIVVLFMPIIIGINGNYFYVHEVSWMQFASEVIVIVVAIFVANYLLKRKIQV